MSRVIIADETVVTLTPGGANSADRDVVHRAGIWHLCVHLLCVSADRVFLQRRKTSRRRNPDRWTSTVSGHVTLEDARSGQAIRTDEYAGRNALRHEAVEELGYELPIEKATFIGEVAAPSIGGGEVCNCSALVFTLNYDSLLERASTDEVEEVAAFAIAEVEAAVLYHGTLSGRDNRAYKLADNFSPVFNLFRAYRAHGHRFRYVAGA